MTVLNLMLGKGRGGLEQAVLDYGEALRLANIPSLTIISPKAWIEAPLVSAGIAHETITNHGQWDIFTLMRLRALAKKTNARAIICHGNRAISLALRALGGRVPVIAVAHNYATRRFPRADGCFAITNHLKEHLTSAGAKNISLMPNMVRTYETALRPAFRTPPVIGTMGRFVNKKGFMTFLEAVSIMRNRGVAFHAILGGDGEQAERMETFIKRYQLEEYVTRIGWVKDKTAFFDALDVFVLPSWEEAFGIVLIEAMNYRMPIVSTDAEGPREILHSGTDGILVPRKNPEKLATAIAELIADPARAAALGEAGHKCVGEQYSMAAMAERLQTALAPYI